MVALICFVLAVLAEAACSVARVERSLPKWAPRARPNEVANDRFWREAAIHQRIASDQIGDGGRPMYS